MAAKNVAVLIREARTGAGLTQEALAKKITGLSASDISKAERGELSLTQEQLKAIAKATGVTQKSLLEAPKAKGSTAKTSGKTSGKTSSKEEKEATLTAAEKKLIKLYRAADSKDRQLAMTILEGKAETGEILMQLLGNKLGEGKTEDTSGLGSLSGLAGLAENGKTGDLVSSLLGNVLGKK